MSRESFNRSSNVDWFFVLLASREDVMQCSRETTLYHHGSLQSRTQSQ